MTAAFAAAACILSLSMPLAAIAQSNAVGPQRDSRESLRGWFESRRHPHSDGRPHSHRPSHSYPDIGPAGHTSGLLAAAERQKSAAQEYHRRADHVLASHGLPRPAAAKSADLALSRGERQFVHRQYREALASFRQASQGYYAVLERQKYMRPAGDARQAAVAAVQRAKRALHGPGHTPYETIALLKSAQQACEEGDAKAQQMLYTQAKWKYDEAVELAQRAEHGSSHHKPPHHRHPREDVTHPTYPHPRHQPPIHRTPHPPVKHPKAPVEHPRHTVEQMIGDPLYWRTTTGHWDSTSTGGMRAHSAARTRFKYDLPGDVDLRFTLRAAGSLKAEVSFVGDGMTIGSHGRSPLTVYGPSVRNTYGREFDGSYHHGRPVEVRIVRRDGRFNLYIDGRLTMTGHCNDARRLTLEVAAEDGWQHRGRVPRAPGGSHWQKSGYVEFDNFRVTRL